MNRPFRRVVTGHNDQGKSVFVIDDTAKHVFTRGPGSTIVTEMWETTATPASNRGHADAIDRQMRLPPPKNGSVFRIIEYPPDKERVAQLHRERASHDDGSGLSNVYDRGNPRHPGFHRTDTVDYALVLAGEIWALMDEGEVKLTAGDVLIQRGTNHAWSNRTEEPAYLAFVLIDAEPV